MFRKVSDTLFNEESGMKGINGAKLKDTGWRIFILRQTAIY